MKKIELPNGAEFDYYTPKELVAYLDQYMIGQENLKKTLSVSIYNHYKRLIMGIKYPKENIDKSNVMILGPTGSGKTFAIKLLAKYIGVGCYIGDATSLTQAGYTGDDIECLITGLLRNVSWSIPRAEFGIICIDEVDKLAKRGSNQHITRDVVGEGVQQGLLKMVEGNLVGVPPQEGRKHPEQQLIYVNTKNILFIGTGAFSGIDEIVKQRLNINKIGFNANSSNYVDINSDDFKPYDYVCQEDLRKFGMIPEFIGRFPIITNVNQLTKDDLVKILTEPKDNIINQFQKMMELDNISLKFSDGALEYIADVAIKLETGARGLRSIVEPILNDYVYELSDDTIETEREIIISPEDVKERLNKRYVNFVK